VSTLEAGAAVVLALGGARSIWVWARRPLDSTQAADHVLYTLFRVGRIGLWWALSGVFAIYATQPGLTTDQFVARYGWFVAVVLVLPTIQLVASFFLSRRP
jgi:hypothetical protein